MKRRPFASFARPALFASTVALGSAATAGCESSGSGNGDRAAYSACIERETAGATGATGATGAIAPQGPFHAALVETRSEDVANVVREDLRREMRASVEAARAQHIAAIRCEHLRPGPGDSLEAAGGGSSSSGGAAAQGRNDATDPGSAKDVSGTNNQVAGVDEADFLKNDGTYIYVASGSDLRIIRAWPAPDAREVARVAVPGTAKKLFVEGDRALVYSSVPKTTQSGSEGGSGGDYAGGVSRYGGSSGECTYGYDGCVPSGDGTETEISLFDIRDRAAPRLIRSVHSSSSFVAARRVGTAVHTVLVEPSLASRIGYETYPSGLGESSSEAQVRAAYDRLLADNESRLAAVDVGAVLPAWSDSAGNVNAATAKIYQSSMPDGTALTSLLSLDLAVDPSLTIASVISRPGWVYASADGLYMAVPHQQIAGWGWYEGRTESELTTVHKFRIGTGPGATTYAGSGAVKGRVLNQLAMDEREGFLRVATTTGHAPDEGAHSTVSVMEDQQGQLAVVGAIDGIAKSEDIRSVRFDGARGYIVTFKKTDPLFVFDLADPRAPKTMGELKIPGFSTYMHMMDATHLLTIGYDAADQGDFAYFTGVLLQIFDVSNPADPKLAHKEVIGTRGTSSEALTNHLAFNYFAPKNLLALPMTICEGGDTNGGYGTEMTFSGLMVYDTTVTSGFALRGKVTHPNSSDSGDQQNGYGYYDMGCSNWWTNASSEVKRSIIMDDYVFSVSDTRIKVNHLGALATDVKELPLK
jgi:hypothetical protein